MLGAVENQEKREREREALHQLKQHGKLSFSRKRTVCMIIIIFFLLTSLRHQVLDHISLALCSCMLK